MATPINENSFHPAENENSQKRERSRFLYISSIIITRMFEVPFQGSNGAGEVETVEEFLLELRHYEGDPSEMSFDGWTFTDIDFNHHDVLPLWDKFDWTGAVFYGCIFPTSLDEVRARGARAVAQLENIPFKAFRSFMYTQDELEEKDAAIYKFYLEDTTLNAKLAQQIHDHFMQDALFDYLENKSVVSIMGGHQLKRASPSYRDVASMAHRLAKRGFLVASGGGPGAMEACNLGAYMFQHSDEELGEAIALMIVHQDPSVEHEYQDRKGPAAVITKYGKPTFQPSLSIPTWKYGHEPTNMFGTWVCKFFSNAIREDGLLDISNAGIVYTPGSAGTRQEIFQAACGNHYAPDGHEKPTVFYDTAFWTETGIPQVLCSVSKGRPFAQWIIESDDVDKIVRRLDEFREENNLPVLTLKRLQSKFWMREYDVPEGCEIFTCNAQQREDRHKLRDERSKRKARQPTDTLPKINYDA
jgi:predicted Rossmann-fold nucleotide-binding protein